MGHTDIVSYLISKGANIHYNKDNEHILLDSIEMKHFDIIDLLLPLYDKEEITEILKNEFIRNQLLLFLSKRNIPNYPILINIYREFGIDLSDLLDNEKN